MRNAAACFRVGIALGLNFLVVGIVLAFILGGIIGLERQKRYIMAGVRTNVLVCTGSFLFVSLSIMMGQ
ncbi:MgtC/SapB family protein [Desulforamulus putei]|uniref:MgtC/SapB family protein n=1 Tax=Desulforamulus putei TaxID=74701 RepID=UPI003A5BA815